MTEHRFSWTQLIDLRMKYKIPDNIKALCDKQDLSDSDEQEKVKQEIVKYLSYYLDLKRGRNSLANVTDIVNDFFKVRGTNYNFERDIAGRMMRTRNYTMKEGVNKAGKEDVLVIAADRDWLDKNKFWFSIAMVIIGTLVGSISNPLSNFLDNLLNGKDKINKSYQIKLKTKSVILGQTDSLYNLEVEKTDSVKGK